MSACWHEPDILGRSVFENPLAGKAPGADLKPLIEYSLELGASLTTTALATLGASPAQLRAYTEAALVGIGGDLSTSSAMDSRAIRRTQTMSTDGWNF